MTEPSPFGGPLGRFSPADAPPHILLVEDNPGDVELAREALAEGGMGSRVSVVSDGVEALAFLRREGRYADVGRPDFVILDLNLPRKDGRAVLAEMCHEEGLREIPVIVLTTSSAPSDVRFAYRHCANSYVRKPLGLDRLVETARAIGDFWFRTATLPGGG